MHVLGLVLLALARILRLLINLYTFIVGAAVIISWVNPDPYNPIVRFLRQATEPVFAQVRRFMPRAAFQWRIDITPLVVLILLMIVDTVLIGLLFDLAWKIST
jgi:YggT family protein